jgi:hypothetical protein
MGEEDLFRQVIPYLPQDETTYRDRKPTGHVEDEPPHSPIELEEVPIRSEAVDEKVEYPGSEAGISTVQRIRLGTEDWCLLDSTSEAEDHQVPLSYQFCRA